MKDNILKGMKILLVEDEETLAVGLDYNLKEEGYVVNWAKDGRQAIEFFEADEFDLIILDIMLPYLDGFEVAQKIRNVSPQMPILMLTARTGAVDKIKGLELGADDYITKPFHLQELLLRIKGMLRRKMWYKEVTTTSPVYKFGNNMVNFETLSANNGNDEINLTQQEAMVLKYLVVNKGKIVSRKELLEKVWHTNPDIETRTVDNFIVRLRKYFEPNPAEPVYFKSVRGAGYMFKEES